MVFIFLLILQSQARSSVGRLATWNLSTTLIKSSYLEDRSARPKQLPLPAGPQPIRCNDNIVYTIYLLHGTNTDNISKDNNNKLSVLMRWKQKCKLKLIKKKIVVICHRNVNVVIILIYDLNVFYCLKSVLRLKDIL